MYPRIAVPCRARAGLRPGDKIQAFDPDDGRALGLIEVIANDTPDGPLILELGADCAPALRNLLLPPGVR